MLVNPTRRHRKQNAPPPSSLSPAGWSYRYYAIQRSEIFRPASSVFYYAIQGIDIFRPTPCVCVCVMSFVAVFHFKTVMLCMGLKHSDPHCVVFIVFCLFVFLNIMIHEGLKYSDPHREFFCYIMLHNGLKYSYPHRACFRLCYTRV